MTEDPLINYMTTQSGFSCKYNFTLKTHFNKLSNR